MSLVRGVATEWDRREPTYQPVEEAPWPEDAPIGARVTPMPPKTNVVGGALPTVSLSALLAESDEEPQRHATGIPAVGVTVLAGPPKVGKSALVMQLALITGSAPEDVSERPLFLGQPVGIGPVVYVVEEGSRAGLRWRARHQAEALALTSEPLIEFVYRQRVRLDDTRSVANLRALVRELDPALVVVDPLNRAHGRNEDKATEMTPVMDALSSVAYDAGNGCAVVVIHHVNKPSEGRNGQDRQRGSTAIRSGSDANLLMEERNGALYLTGEYRDFPDLSVFLAFDTDTLLFSVGEAPAAPEPANRKITMPDLLEYVEGQGKVRASKVAERFGVAVNTAKTALNEATVRGHLDAVEAGRTRLYFLPTS